MTTQSPAPGFRTAAAITLFGSIQSAVTGFAATYVFFAARTVKVLEEGSNTARALDAIQNEQARNHTKGIVLGLVVAVGVGITFWVIARRIAEKWQREVAPESSSE